MSTSTPQPVAGTHTMLQWWVYSTPWSQKLSGALNYTCILFLILLKSKSSFFIYHDWNFNGSHCTMFKEDYVDQDWCKYDPAHV